MTALHPLPSYSCIFLLRLIVGGKERVRRQETVFRNTAIKLTTNLLITHDTLAPTRIKVN